MFIIIYQDEDGLWKTVDAVMISGDPKTPLLTEPQFFDSFDEALDFAKTEFIDQTFEIMGVLAHGEMREGQLELLHNDGYLDILNYDIMREKNEH